MKKWKIFRCGIILLCEIIFLCEFIECGKTVDTPRHLVKSSQSANNPISHPSIPFAGKIDEAYNGILNTNEATFKYNINKKSYFQLYLRVIAHIVLRIGIIAKGVQNPEELKTEPKPEEYFLAAAFLEHMPNFSKVKPYGTVFFIIDVCRIDIQTWYDYTSTYHENQMRDNIQQLGKVAKAFRDSWNAFEGNKMIEATIEAATILWYSSVNHGRVNPHPIRAQLMLGRIAEWSNIRIEDLILLSSDPDYIIPWDLQCKVKFAKEMSERLNKIPPADAERYLLYAKDDIMEKKNTPETDPFDYYALRNLRKHKLEEGTSELQSADRIFDRVIRLKNIPPVYVRLINFNVKTNFDPKSKNPGILEILLEALQYTKIRFDKWKTESEDIKRKYKEGVVNSEELPVLSPTEVELFLASALLENIPKLLRESAFTVISKAHTIIAKIRNELRNTDDEKKGSENLLTIRMIYGYFQSCWKDIEDGHTVATAKILWYTILDQKIPLETRRRLAEALAISGVSPEQLFLFINEPDSIMPFEFPAGLRSKHIHKLSPADRERYLNHYLDDIAEVEKVYGDDDYDSVGIFTSNVRVINIADRTGGPRSAKRVFNRIIRCNQSSKSYLSLLNTSPNIFDIKMDNLILPLDIIIRAFSPTMNMIKEFEERKKVEDEEEKKKHEDENAKEEEKENSKKIPEMEPKLEEILLATALVNHMQSLKPGSPQKIISQADAAVQKIRSIINTKFKENMENKTEDGEKIEWTEKEKKRIDGKLRQLKLVTKQFHDDWGALDKEHTQNGIIVRISLRLYGLWNETDENRITEEMKKLLPKIFKESGVDVDIVAIIARQSPSRIRIPANFPSKLQFALALLLHTYKPPPGLFRIYEEKYASKSAR